MRIRIQALVVVCTLVLSAGMLAQQSILPMRSGSVRFAVIGDSGAEGVFLAALGARFLDMAADRAFAVALALIASVDDHFGRIGLGFLFHDQRVIGDLPLGPFGI